MDRKKLLIIGGGALNSKAIQDAKIYGFETYVADGNPDAPCFKIADVAICADIRDAANLMPYVQKYGIDGAVTMAEVGVKPAATINAYLGRKVVSEQTAEWATSKAWMRKKWSSSQYSVPFHCVTTLEEVWTAIDQLEYFPLIVKPDKTYGGSRGVSKVSSRFEVEAAFLFAKENGMNEIVVIEQCAQGPEFSCEVLVINNKALVLAIGEKVKSPLPYRVDCSVQYQGKLDKKQLQMVDDMAQSATSLLEIENGVAHIEFAMTAAGPRLFELGVRCGGGHTPMIANHVSGIHEFIQYCRLSCGEEVNLGELPVPKGADYRFIIFEPGVITKVDIQPHIHEIPGVYDVVVTLKAGDEQKPLRTTSDRAGALVTFGVDKKDAVRIANEACKFITVTYDDGRIAHPIIFD